MILTNKLRKYIRSLHLNKYRQKYNKFIAEGPKICAEFIQSTTNYEIDNIVCTQEWYDKNDRVIQSVTDKAVITDEKGLQSISLLQKANDVLIVADKGSQVHIDATSISDQWALYTDQVQDPGNMGTIIRIADWYGINTVITSPDSVDCYNPKVVQSAMGSHNRIALYSIDAQTWPLEEVETYALVLGGEDLTQLSMTSLKPGLLILGNESKGIKPALSKECKHRVTIPKKGGAESLNVAVACGIACQLLVK
ncbi:RNA methyltransferase [Saprospiraceae bacterium]|nr:RNA methyltransferase [Saprospiraceae bacterium]